MRYRRQFTIATAALLLAMAACGPSARPSPTPHPPTPTLGTNQPAVGDLKPVLRGLLDRSGLPPSPFVSALSGYVVNAHWADLQPSQGGAIASTSVIDTAVSQVRALNAADHVQLGLKVRVFAGVWAPDWVKSLGGAPIAIINPQNGAQGTIGRFWTDAFGQAYDSLYSQLAAKYDSVPEVREVTISRCTMFYAEPFVRDMSEATDVQALLGAGYSLQADQQCQEQEIAASTVWRHTHSDLSFNPYQVINADGTTSTDESFTNAMMAYCRASLGHACVLENNSLRTPPLPSYVAMYMEMTTLGEPIAFQTETAQRVGDLQTTLNTAVALGANSVELPSGYQNLATPTSYSATAAQLIAHPSG